jgi:hypothetical protein
MQGRRVYPDSDAYLACNMEPGDYGKSIDGAWYVCTPKDGLTRITGNGENMANWKVEEHADGTITVSPSINQIGLWHGFLEKGTWREV